MGFRLAEKQHRLRTSPELKRCVLAAIREKSVAESEIIICSLLAITPKVRTKIKRQSDGSVRVEMTFSKVQWAKLERVKELLSQSVPTGDLSEWIEYVCDRVIVQKDKCRPQPKGKTSHVRGKNQYCRQENSPNFNAPDDPGKSAHASEDLPIGNPETPASSSSTRTPIKIAVQRQVFQRDQCCQHPDPSTGKLCGSRWHLQLDHLQPVWAGGSNEPENIRLLCGSHNRDRYRRQAGLRVQ